MLTTKTARRKKSTAGAKSPPVRQATITFSVSCTAADLKLIKARLDSLVVLDRSGYIIALVRQDCAHPREFTIVPRDQVLSSEPQPKDKA